MITPGDLATAATPFSAAARAESTSFPNSHKLPPISPGAITESPIEDELAAKYRDPPHLAAEALDPLLIAVAEEGHLATHPEILRRVEQVEARCRRAGEDVLADPHEGRALKGLLAVLAEIGNVQLHDGPGPAVRREVGLRRSGTDVTVQGPLRSRT